MNFLVSVSIDFTKDLPHIDKVISRMKVFKNDARGLVPTVNGTKELKKTGAKFSGKKIP